MFFLVAREVVKTGARLCARRVSVRELRVRVPGAGASTRFLTGAVLDAGGGVGVDWWAGAKDPLPYGRGSGEIARSPLKRAGE